MNDARELAIMGGDAPEKSTPAAFLGSVQLLAGEDAVHYEELLARITGALQPSDVLEEIWVRDVADLVWDALRLRRLKASLLAGCVEEGLGKVLRGLGLPEPDRSSCSWAADPAAVDRIEAALAAAGSSLEMVVAQTLSPRIDDIDRIDRMTMAAEARRNAALQEIERHRASFATRLRGAIDEVAVVERKVIAPENAPAGEPA
jgi:hypothetical protein